MEVNITKEIELRKAPTLKALITIMTLLLTTVSILAVVMIGYYNLNLMFQNLVKDKCVNMVQMMSLYVDADKLNESILKYDAEDPYLAELQQELYHVKEKTNAQYIYIILQNGEYVEYIVDGSCAVTDPDYMPLGGLEPIEDYEGVENAFSTGNIATSQLYVYDDDDGNIYNLISGYYPIKSSDGEVIAVLGGDISVNQDIEELNKIISEFIIAFFVLVVISGAVAILFCMRLFGPLSRIVGYIRELSKGDFTIQYNYNKNDETGKINQSLRYLINSLKRMFAVIVGSAGSLGETAKVLDDNTEQIAISIQGVNLAVGNIAASAGEQTQYAGMGMESMEELNKNIGLNISNLEELISILGKVALCKDDGLHSIESLKQQSAASGETLRKMGVDIGKTSDSVSHIGAASTTIKNIASQTNLLALNASIEAARAGESGKGFAVVAEEIRKLSEESNASADEISNVIEVLIKNSENMVVTMEEMSRSMAEQMGSVSHTEESFEQISRSIDSTHESLKNLSASTVSMEKVEKELYSVFKEIKESIDNNAAASEEVSASMQEQTAIIEEIAGRAKQLTTETEKLGDSLKVFSF